jgi:hypothetical protein
MKRDSPAVAKRARKENAEIHRSDETAVSDQSNHGRSFAPAGETPVIPPHGSPSP